MRLVGILSACTVKMPKPRPDGSVGEKWAIFGLDDATGQADAMCYAKPWKQFNADGKIERAVDQLVMVCGEVTHRTNYDKEDLHKERPQVGDVSFSVKEVYPLDEALPLVSKGLRLRMRQSDPQLKEKLLSVKAAIDRNPGRLPVYVDLLYDNGTLVKIDLGETCRVAVTLAFLSELDKVVPQGDTSFAPEEKILLAPREPKPWEM